MTQQHDVDQGYQFPEECGAGSQKVGSQAVDEGYTDCQGDESHHARSAVLDFGHRHLQKWQTAVEEDNNAKEGRD